MRQKILFDVVIVFLLVVATLPITLPAVSELYEMSQHPPKKG